MRSKTYRLPEVTYKQKREDVALLEPGDRLPIKVTSRRLQRLLYKIIEL